MAHDILKDGSVSEWNEGNLKSTRLHEAQTIINYAKMNLLAMSGDSFNYEMWISGIDILYGEGQSKYKEKEIEDVEKVRTIISLLIEYKFPHQVINEETSSGKRQKIMFDKKNWQVLKVATELFEKIVKQYNDSHGLSTRNQGGQGLF